MKPIRPIMEKNRKVRGYKVTSALVIAQIGGRLLGTLSVIY